MDKTKELLQLPFNAQTPVLLETATLHKALQLKQSQSSTYLCWSSNHYRQWKSEDFHWSVAWGKNCTCLQSVKLNLCTFSLLGLLRSRTQSVRNSNLASLQGMVKEWNWSYELFHLSATHDCSAHLSLKRVLQSPVQTWSWLADSAEVDYVLEVNVPTRALIWASSLTGNINQPYTHLHWCSQDQHLPLQAEFGWPHRMILGVSVTLHYEGWVIYPWEFRSANFT